MPTILYEDDAILLVQKPVGLTSQTDAAGGDSLPARLEAMGKPVKPVHRLDKLTGGVMAYARTADAAAVLSKQIQEHTVFVKDYLAIISGRPQTDTGTLEDWLYHDVRRNKSYAVARKRGGVRHAKLTYTVLQSRETPQGVQSLVLVRLYTGRTHQIRVQFASRQMPLIGDARYGGCRGVPLALWSYRLSLRHPVTGKPLETTCSPDTTQPPWQEWDVSAAEISSIL